MRDMCELIFLDRIYARNGGSGVGMTEAKDLMTKNGMYISTALNRENGTQFLLAFPRAPLDEKTLKERVAKTEEQLDRKENEKLNLPMAA